MPRRNRHRRPLRFTLAFELAEPEPTYEELAREIVRAGIRTKVILDRPHHLHLTDQATPDERNHR